MDSRTPQDAVALLSELRSGLDELDQGITRLRELLEVQLEQEPVAPARFTGMAPAGQAPTARAVAAQMVLTGSSRADARDRLAGLVSGDELREILDEAYAG